MTGLQDFACGLAAGSGCSRLTHGLNCQNKCNYLMEAATYASHLNSSVLSKHNAAVRIVS